MRVKMHDTVLIMENTEVSSRCIALQISTEVLMKSIDKEFIRTTLDRDTPSRMWSLTKVDVPNMAMYFAKTDDIFDNGVVAAEKRDILQPMEMHLNWEVHLRYDFPVNYINDSVMKITCDEILFKLSIEDVHTISTVSAKQ